MDIFFPDDEYQTLLTFCPESVELEYLYELIRQAQLEVAKHEVELLHVLPINDPSEVKKIRGILINEQSYAPAAIVISVKSYLNPEGKERPVSWYAETDLRRALLVEVEAQGLGVYYRPVYPNLHIIEQLRVALNNPSEFLPMACIFLGWPDQTQAGSLQKFESKVKRDKDSADQWSAGL